MNRIFWAALGIGGSTLAGTACGFLFSRVTDTWNGVVTAFAAGVMLSAAAFGLFVPAMELSDGWMILLLAAGTACGFSEGQQPSVDVLQTDAHEPFARCGAPAGEAQGFQRHQNHPADQPQHPIQNVGSMAHI